ncbi:hypothetical protein EAY39_26745, partial [Vibrio anguillarum]|nr:hypothetical protein [Vibrio anguillarum]
ELSSLYKENVGHIVQLSKPFINRKGTSALFMFKVRSFNDSLSEQLRLNSCQNKCVADQTPTLQFKIEC